jgi:adenosine deaminase CECR1
MVGSPSITIHSWKQLAEWSIEFSCLSEEQRSEANAIFSKEWESFCVWIDETFGADADSLTVSS